VADEGGKDNKQGGVLKDLVKAEAMLQLAIALPLGCLIGWGLGDLLDRHFHTTWIAVVGILLGAAAGFVQIITTAKRFLKKEDE
jgi:ATP synthase protein I